MIIAELGLNHLGTQSGVQLLLDSCLKSDIDAITMQVREKSYYTQANQEFLLDDEVYRNCCNAVKAKNKKFGVAIADIDKVDFFNSLNVDFYKILSKDIRNTELLEKVAKSVKPVYMSTGLSANDDIGETVRFFRERSIEPVLIHTALDYDPQKVNLKALQKMRDDFGIKVAYGNHSPYLELLLAALVFEPESLFFYVKGNLSGKFKDDKHAIPVSELDHYLELFNIVSAALGTGEKQRMVNTINNRG